jgi:MFS family permease
VVQPRCKFSDIHSEVSVWKCNVRGTQIIFSLCLGSVSYGYDFSIVTFTIGQPNFYTYMGLSADPTDANFEYSNSIIGTILGLFAAGAVFGALFAGWFCDAYGRKKLLIVAAIINIIGGALQTGSVHIGMFIAARFITGFAAGRSRRLFASERPAPLTASYSYVRFNGSAIHCRSGTTCSQRPACWPARFVIPHHQRRSLILTADAGASFLFGYTIASWVSVGSFFATHSEFQWRFPLALQILWPALMLVFVRGVPESPRWRKCIRRPTARTRMLKDPLVISNGQSEKAWTIIAKLHHDPADPSQLFAREEFYQMGEQTTRDNAIYGHITVLDMFRTPQFRKRMIAAAVVMATSQLTGNLVIYST